MAGSRRTEYEIAMQIQGEVAGSFGKSISNVNKEFDSMANMANSATASVNSGFERMADMAGTAAKLATAAFAAVQVGQFVSDAIDTYAEFEQSMANTAAIANATQQEYEMLEEAAREMGKATTKTAAEASDALGYMMLAGWNVGDSIAGLEPVLRLSEATQMDLARCSDLVTDSMSALGLSVDGLSGYLDMCTAANNSANTTAEALMEAFIGCGGAARTTGADLNEVATALGILANNGTKGAEAGTAMNSMLVRMTSKDVAINAMKELGVAVFNDAGEFRGLRNVLADVQGALASLTAEEKASYMSRIAGTNYYTEMGYLLASVADNAEDSVSYLQAAGLEGEELAAALAAVGDSTSAWDGLSASLENSDGALMNMADTVTNTLQGAFSRLESATDDAKISLADAFSGDLKNMINDLAGYIPVLTQGFIDFSVKAGPKISSAFAAARKTAGGAWEVISGIGGWLLEHSDGVQIAIIGIGSAIAAYKVINGIVGMVEAFRSLSFVLTNPWLTVLVGVAAAITGIAMAVKAAEREAAKSNLAEHFGDIALSMEDISKTAEYIVASDDLSKIHESMAAFAELSGIERSMQESIDAINKMNWKVSIGMELSADEKASYVTEIQNYISQAQAYVEQQQYALNVNLALFAEGDLERQNIVDQLNSFYENKYSELEQIGAKLNETVTAAFEDGLLDMDEAKEIAELQQQMARIQEAIATSDFEAKLKVMELQYSGKDLDSESFMALQKELVAQTEAAAAEYEKSLQLRIANYQVMLDDGAIDQAQYDAAVSEFWEDYMESMTVLETKALDFQTNTIMQLYGEDIEAFYSHLSSVMDKYSDGSFLKDWTEGSLAEGVVREIYNNDISSDTKNAVAMLLESMEPSIQQIESLKERYAELGMDVPETLLDTLAKTEMLSAMTTYHKAIGTSGNVGSVWKVMLQEISNRDDYELVEQELRELGCMLPEAFAEEWEIAKTETISPAVDDVYAYSQEYINEVFSEGFTAIANVGITLVPTYSSVPRSGFVGSQETIPSGKQFLGTEVSLAGHAEGGIFDRPHVAWFAEDGPEAAIPLDGSSNAVSLWEKVGQLLGIFDGGMRSSAVESLYRDMTASRITDNSTMDQSSDSRQFVFAPQINIEGNADREDMDGIMTDKMEEFREMMEWYIAEKKRSSFA